MADVVSAKQGYPNMGMSACFGGPLFSNLFTFFSILIYLTLNKKFYSDILLGVGIPFTYGCIKSGGAGFAVSITKYILYWKKRLV